MVLFHGSLTDRYSWASGHSVEGTQALSHSSQGVQGDSHSPRVDLGGYPEPQCSGFSNEDTDFYIMKKSHLFLYIFLLVYFSFPSSISITLSLQEGQFLRTQRASILQWLYLSLSHQARNSLMVLLWALRIFVVRF